MSLLKHLRSVKLSNWTQISTCGIKQLATLHIERLDLTGSFGFDHTALKYLSHIKKTLKFLDLSFCSQVSSNSLKHLEGLDLEFLSLKMCIRVANNGLKHLVKLHNLKELNIYGCSQVTDDGAKSLASLQKLTSLDVSYCVQLSDVGLSFLGRLPALETLEMEGCGKVTESGLLHLRSLKHVNAFGCAMADESCNCCFDILDEHRDGFSSPYKNMKEGYQIRQGDGIDHRRVPKHVKFCV